jgi:hypothetical protein
LVVEDQPGEPPACRHRIGSRRPGRRCRFFGRTR